jgi:hypothetical protein
VTVTEKAWKDLTKEERAARIKDGQRKANEKRQALRAESDAAVEKIASGVTPEVAALIAAEVARALAGVRAVQTQQVESLDLAAIAKKDPMTWTAEEKELLRKEHERLQAALEAIPYKGEDVSGLRPGTVIGEGFNREYVAATAEWYMDVEARRKDRNYHNGKPAELTWPNYQLHDVFYQGTHPWLPISINGVTFNLLPGIQCKLPTPFYHRYMKFIQAGPKNDALFAPPPNPGTGNGYFHVSPKTGLAVILGKGPLDSVEAREAKDAKYEG